MSIKIHDGTPNHAENLCDSCVNCIHIQGHAPSQEHRFCDANFEVRLRLTFPVARCTDFHKRSEKALKSMQEIAWIIRTNTSGVALGFQGPKEFREKNPDEDIVPSGKAR